jgi:hypothetical protein
MTLSSILCAGGDNINRVQKNVFMRVHDNSEYITCNKIPQLNINMWSDENKQILYHIIQKIHQNSHTKI